MKGNEIIRHITQSKIPDVRQVRDECLNQPTHTRGFRRLRLSTAVAIAAAFLIFATAAYAVADRVYQRVETGGNWDIVVFPDDAYGRMAYDEAWGDIRFIHHHYPIYCSFTENLRVPPISAAGAQFINDELAGRIFTAGGALIDFDLAVRMPNFLDFRRYHLDSKGNALYTAGGHPVGTIYLVTDTQGERIRVDIQTAEQVIAAWGYNSTYDEIVEAFDTPIRLPSAHMDNFQAPAFRLDNRMRYSVCGGVEWEARITYNMRELRNIRDKCPHAMTIRIEAARDENDRRAWTMYYIGEVIAHNIAGVAVHELNLVDTVHHFIWQHEDLVYTLFPSSRHNHAQILEVIRSMVG